MTPKEKCNELVDKMYSQSTTLHDAQRCALIAVDEILEECDLFRDWYWEEVKTEIKNL